MTTFINSNGSKWAGSEPDSIETLCGVLAEYTLDRTFEEYGNFICVREDGPREGLTSFFGNFFALSHVFNIDTDDAALIEKLTKLIRANQLRAEYQAQQTPAERKAEEDAADQNRMAARQAQREAEARAVLGLEA